MFGMSELPFDVLALVLERVTIYKHKWEYEKTQEDKK